MNRARRTALLGALVAGTIGMAPVSSGFGAAARDLREIIDGNRLLLNDLQVEIRSYRDAESALVQRDLWAASGGRFRHEIRRDSQEEGREFHAASASDGRYQTDVLYHRNQGSVQTAWPRAVDHPAVSPWRLFGTVGMGLEDPIAWLEREDLVVTDDTDGRVRVEIPGNARGVGAGQAGLTSQPYAKRTIVFDRHHGGTVLSLEDRDAAGRLLQELQNADVRRSERGAWYPGKTVLTQYFNGQAVRRSIREIGTLRHLSPADEGCFKIEFPRDMVVIDHPTELAYMVGEVDDFLSKWQDDSLPMETQSLPQVDPVVARPAETGARPETLLSHGAPALRGTVPEASRAARTHASARQRWGWILILPAAVGAGLLATRMGVFRTRARPPIV